MSDIFNREVDGNKGKIIMVKIDEEIIRKFKDDLRGELIIR